MPRRRSCWPSRPLTTSHLGGYLLGTILGAAGGAGGVRLGAQRAARASGAPGAAWLHPDPAATHPTCRPARRTGSRGAVPRDGAGRLGAGHPPRPACAPTGCARSWWRPELARPEWTRPEPVTRAMAGRGRPGAPATGRSPEAPETGPLPEGQDCSDRSLTSASGCAPLASARFCGGGRVRRPRLLRPVVVLGVAELGRAAPQDRRRGSRWQPPRSASRLPASSTSRAACGRA